MKTDKKSFVRKSVESVNQNVLAKDLKRVQTIGRSRISATAILKAFEEVMSELEQAVRYMLTSIKKTCGREIEKYFGISEFQLKKPIPRITMAR